MNSTKPEMNNSKPTHCLNCGVELKGLFCHHCGQKNKSYQVSFKQLLSEFLGDYLTFDSKFFRSLKPLLFKPGFLTNEYMAGRRVRYIPPLRLYLFISLIFFFINSDAKRKNEYGNLLSEICDVYNELTSQADLVLVLSYLKKSSQLLSFASTIYEAAIEKQKDDVERKSAYMDRNFTQTKQRLKIGLKNFYAPTDKIIFNEMLLRAAKLPQSMQIPAIKKLIGNKNPETAINEFLENAYTQSKLYEEKFLFEALKKSAKQVKKMKDPFIQLAIELYPTFEKFEEDGKTRRGKLDKLYAKLIDVKKEFLAKDFIPDADRTLRLTYGRIRGYSPYDAVYFNPISSTNGVLEKTAGKAPFDTPKKLLDLIRTKDFGRFYFEKVDGVPVGILYNMDTTGGNSGSPVLNARGELVGINFDRAFEATINDFAWSESYSRSIAVDIRYVLWVTQKFGGADYLLKEMRVL